MTDVTQLEKQELADWLSSHGVQAWNAVRSEYPDWVPDLRGADLINAMLGPSSEIFFVEGCDCEYCQKLMFSHFLELFDS